MEALTQSYPYLLKGALQTVLMSLFTVIVGTALGAVFGLIAVSKYRALRALVDAYVFVTRGIPVLVLMFVTYYAFPAMGYRISNTAAVTVALVLYAAAFYADVVRGAIRTLSRGQAEAAMSLGMPRRWIMLEILLPQAFKPSLPPWLNTSIVMVKSTSYASIVGAWELTYASKEVVERTLATFEIFSAVMLFYFIICWPLSLLSRRLEQQSAVAN